MIPKTIHSIWLSGDEKPRIYQDCIASWHTVLQDYDIKEWNMDNLPAEVLEFPWVRDAIKAKKWAYACDYIRFWLLYTYGGIYLDMDVVVFKPFDVFLTHRVFTCAEYNTLEYKSSIRKFRDRGIGIEAAVIGAEKGHEWCRDILDFYIGKPFKTNRAYLLKYILPEVVKKVSVQKYGFVLTPNYQVMQGDIHVYPPEAFTWVDAVCGWYDKYDKQTMIQMLGRSPLRYCMHLTVHSWLTPTLAEKIVWRIKQLFK